MQEHTDQAADQRTVDPDKLETTVDTNLNAAFDTALLGDTITIP